MERGEIDHLALLARLELSDEEKKLFTEQLSRIVKAVEKINELDFAGIEPMTSPLPIENIFRDDVVTAPLSREQALAMAPAASAEGFLVPQVLHGGES